MKTCGLLLIGCVAAAACGPKDVIPGAPAHPANPAAPVVDVAPPVAADAAPASPEPSPPAPAVDKTAIAAAEQAAYAKARPVLERYCAGCHTSAGTKKGKKKALPHFSMDSYPFTGHHSEDLAQRVREVLGATGEKPAMPADKPGAVTGPELDAIVEWTQAFDAAHAAGVHQKSGHEGHHH